MRRALFTVALAALAAAGCSSTDEPPDGAPVSELMAAAREQAAQDHPNRASDLYERVTEEYRETPEAEEAAWMRAETRFHQERLKKARTAYQEYHETHPLGRLGELENRMYDLGVKLYEDGMTGLFGLGIFPSPGESFDTFDWLVENLPTGARADDALMFKARARVEDERWADAVMDLDRILTDYPESEWTLEARFLKAGSHRRLARGAPYDEKALLDARRSYEVYVSLVEKDPARQVEYAERVAEAKAAIAEIDRVLAEKKLLIARFYLGRERPEPARIYLAETVAKKPGTPAAEEAQKLLDDLRGPSR